MKSNLVIYFLVIVMLQFNLKGSFGGYRHLVSYSLPFPQEGKGLILKVFNSFSW